MERVIWVLVFVSCSANILTRAAADDQRPRQILVDTDMESDDFIALLYLLKLNRSEFNLKAITINANSWSNAGHSVNHVYDILHMMGQDDIPVGVGGEGGILPNGTIIPDVGGYFPIIEQGTSTAGSCRYRQAIPLGQGGRLDMDTNFGVRRGFLPQGDRKYSPLRQPTVQQVMIDAISSGPITVFLLGAHTNFAIFLMTSSHLKKNVEHIYVMGGGVRSENPAGCCPMNASSSCKPGECGDRGNLFTGYNSNPYAEFNIFGDPFAAYQVLHSGIPVTLIPLDATNSIPMSEEFFIAFANNQETVEAQYCFQTLRSARDASYSYESFYSSYFFWDSFTAAVAVSIMRNEHDPVLGENEFAEMDHLNITVVTSNKPYGISDGSNPFFDGQAIPKFNLQKGGVHSGHVQVGLQDPFCLVENGKGKCKDGYTKELIGPDAVKVLIAKKAKPNRDTGCPLKIEFFKNLLDVLNSPEHSGRFNLTTQFPYYKKNVVKPDFDTRESGQPLVFDMDMSPGDFIALVYLLKISTELINLKAILVSGNGWANPATIDIVYDILHMMGRDDIPVGLGSLFALNEQYSSSMTVGDCKYIKAIPHGSGGQLDSDTLYGLSRMLPRSPRRYVAANYAKMGTPRDNYNPELRQPCASEVWDSIAKAMDPGQKITILTSGPLTNLANILSGKNASSIIQSVYIVGGHTSDTEEKGNLFTIPSNKYGEFNLFLDPLAAKIVIQSEINIILIPLSIQREVSSFDTILRALRKTNKTPEAAFVHHLLSRLHHLQQKHDRYHHVSMFLGEILGAIILANGYLLNPATQAKLVNVVATGDVSKDGQIVIDAKNGKLVNILESVDSETYYRHISELLGKQTRSAVIGCFSDQKRIWSTGSNEVAIMSKTSLSYISSIVKRFLSRTGELLQ